MTYIDQFELNGRVALVTGAGSGIGRHCAETLANAGATVVLAARRRQKLEETAKLIEDKGGSAICIDLDVTDSTSVRDCYAEAESSVGTADILVNNAGISRAGFLNDLTEEDWDAVIDTNLKGVFLVAQAAAQAMIRSEKRGSIINIASVLGFRVSKMMGSYIAAKSGAVNLIKAMALEWAKYGIRTNAIAPGPFPTKGAWKRLVPPGLNIEKKMIERVPLKRFGEHDELANLASYLMADESEYMNGEVITMDGGEWLKGAGQFNALEKMPNLAWKAMALARRKKK